ncbi:hypothetical protein BXO88_06875 [Oribacterium sp. C9]|uniref:LytR/AlgR family response regulator transcription factor n=1 Tax=Oribacterium sp. C9 TaxID=1943579 RepID=UPI00098EBCDC|nr:LytTR family DNA-binding domain-containing protein [Oribacterium sp. C9]OON86709.1 hypothetical protein BXO88_06875 [Oribacterium sp. C9]
MWNLLICDDENQMIVSLKDMIRRFTNETNIQFNISECHSAGELLNDFNDSIDLILLDISMGTLSGMDAAKIIRERNRDVVIIFVTSMTQYALEGYSVHAFGFLKKPIRYADIRLQLLDATMHLNSHKKEFLTIEVDNAPYRLDIAEILFLEVQDHDILIHTLSESLLVHESMNEMESRLKEHYFFRCHRSYLVNLRMVATVNGADVVLKNKTTVPLSKYKKKEFLEAFTFYLGVEN